MGAINLQILAAKISKWLLSTCSLLVTLPLRMMLSFLKPYVAMCWTKYLLHCPRNRVLPTCSYPQQCVSEWWLLICGLITTLCLVTVLLVTERAYTEHDLLTVVVVTVQAFTEHYLVTVLLFTVQAYTEHDLFTLLCEWWLSIEVSWLPP